MGTLHFWELLHKFKATVGGSRSGGMLHQEVLYVLSLLHQSGGYFLGHCQCPLLTNNFGRYRCTQYRFPPVIATDFHTYSSEVTNLPRWCAIWHSVWVSFIYASDWVHLPWLSSDFSKLIPTTHLKLGTCILCTNLLWSQSCWSANKNNTTTIV